ncbi:MAG: DNA-binding protein WhiA [Clostridia bacterium]|nr:DNA-binding protein WhiA [Clostridia bacterium]
MSFSADVKEELSRHTGTARHCQIAELAAIVALCGRVEKDENGLFSLKISTENKIVIRKCFTLLEKTFNINACNPKEDINLKKGNTYTVQLDDDRQVQKMLQAFKVLEDGKLVLPNGLVNPMLIQMTCCKRAFIRGAFLAAGSVSDPNKFYHFEVVCDTPVQACQIRDVMNTFDAEAKVIQRKKYYVVYVKEGTQISDLLNVMEASVSLMNFENVRILKEMRNSLNRQVNCETANLNKTVLAAVRQIEDIECIRDTIGFESLNAGLRDVAVARLENPDMNLKDLGGLLSPPVGKSGVNHRLRKLSEIAESLRGDAKV